MSKSKPRAPSYADMIDLPDDPIEAPAQAVAARAAPAVDPAPVVDPGQEKASDPFEGMSLEEQGRAVNAAIVADLERQDREMEAVSARIRAGDIPEGYVSVSKKRAPGAEPAKAKAEPPKPAAARKASGVPSRREAARLRRLEPKPEPADYAQRSLYAREETFALFRKLAFDNGKAAQELYREGLYLVLQKYGHADGLTVDDM